MTRKNGTESRQDEVERETREESRETISVVALDRTPRDEKRRRERAVAGDAAEVEFHERSWIPARHDSLDEIRNAVDALPAPDGAAPASEPAPAVESVAPEPVAPARAAAVETPPGPEALARELVPERATRDPVEPLTDEERAVVDHNVHGHLLHAEVLYRTGQSFVAEARYRTSKGEERTTLVSVTGHRGRELEDVRSVVDGLEVKASSAPEPKSRFSIPGLRRDKPSEEKAAQPDEGPKRRFGLPKLGRKPDGDTTAAADDAIESASGKRRFAWPKRARAEAAPPGDATPPEKKRFRFGRSKE